MEIWSGVFLALMCMNHFGILFKHRFSRSEAGPQESAFLTSALMLLVFPAQIHTPSSKRQCWAVWNNFWSTGGEELGFQTPQFYARLKVCKTAHRHEGAQ
jgi:hypothetical protein